MLYWIMRNYCWLWSDICGIRDIYFQPMDDLFKKVGEKVSKIWINTPIPLDSRQTINGKNINYYNCRSLDKLLNHMDLLKQRTTHEVFRRNDETSTFQLVNVKTWQFFPWHQAKSSTLWADVPEGSKNCSKNSYRKYWLKNEQNPCNYSGTGNKKGCKLNEGYYLYPSVLHKRSSIYS